MSKLVYNYNEFVAHTTRPGMKTKWTRTRTRTRTRTKMMAMATLLSSLVFEWIGPIWRTVATSVFRRIRFISNRFFCPQR
jgi:hypothetical protein